MYDDAIMFLVSVKVKTETDTEETVKRKLIGSFDATTELGNILMNFHEDCLSCSENIDCVVDEKRYFIQNLKKFSSSPEIEKVEQLLQGVDCSYIRLEWGYKKDSWRFDYDKER